MEIHSLPELIQWALPKVSEEIKITAASESNILFAMYAWLFYSNRKGCFIAAFFIVETIGVISYTELHYRYLSYAVIYSFTYWYLFINNYRLKIMSGYVIMLLFQLVMTADAYYYPKTKTFLYVSYEYIIVAIHCYIISTIMDRGAFIKVLGDCARRVFNMLDIGYRLSFCYYSLKFNQSKKQQCH